MTKRSFILACSLLHGLTVIGMDQSPRDALNNSTDKLRNSQGVLSRSQSQEFNKLAKRASAATIYYDFRDKFAPIYETRGYVLMPPQHHHSDCP
jgi:hypothetical protein